MARALGLSRLLQPNAAGDTSCRTCLISFLSLCCSVEQAAYGYGNGHRIWEGDNMDAGGSNFFGRLFKTIETLINIAGLVIIFFAGLYTLYRIPGHFRRYRDAPTPRERSFFQLKLLACSSGGYGFVVMLMLIAGPDWFADYWPALCALWTDHGGFGDAGHHDAVAGDMSLCLLACGALHIQASRLGKVMEDCDGDEMFISQNS